MNEHPTHEDVERGARRRPAPEWIIDDTEE